MRTNLIPPKARLERTLRIVRQFIKDTGICMLPIDPFKIYKEFDWALFSCKEIEELKGKDDLLLLKIRKEKADAITFRDRQTGTYITVYEENNLPERIRWTLAHEIAHIKLDHLTDFNETCMSRGGISAQQYKVLEREANIFAAEFLSPMALLVLLEATQSDQIISYCQISKEAADHREREIRSYWGLKVYSQSTTFYKEQFRNFLNDINKVISFNSNYDKDGIIAMGVPTDENNRFLTCPRCNKSDFSKVARYCTLCGLFLFNSCSNTYAVEDGYCNHVNDGNARYCEICGAPTVLFTLGILQSWEEIRKSSSRNEDLNKKAENIFHLVKGTTGK
ncbi:protein of unknown function [Desulforamulus putei DSM 12395]|uniref:IrrE N-terminal-like domain-containing protein n=1 Tax=Desulforamulus putei DSM 12395 TaxID=1121429 RepID=A0A1M5D2N6_9FIRM|nr:ImmA/IrrE family metallo-endopeptidase [Desulforamulus putei]SHF61135.1 protein of unknown function [Desulforamulus putei DSM 12395]